MYKEKYKGVKILQNIYLTQKKEVMDQEGNENNRRHIENKQQYDRCKFYLLSNNVKYK